MTWLMILLSVDFAAAIPRGTSAQQPLCALTATAAASSVLLGLPVQVTVKCTNTNQTAVTAVLLLNPEDGQLSVSISSVNSPTRDYLGPGWGLVDIDVEPVTLQPGQRVEESTQILWNQLRPSDEDALDRSLAFEQPGRYGVVCHLRLGSQTLEAPLVEIEAVMPSGNDLQVWNRIRANPRIARAMQTLDAHDADVVAADVVDVLKTYPDTAYEQNLRSVIAAASGQ